MAEVNCCRSTVAERKNVLRQLEGMWLHCSLRPRYRTVRFEVLDARVMDV